MEDELLLKVNFQNLPSNENKIIKSITNILPSNKSIFHKSLQTLDWYSETFHLASIGESFSNIKHLLLDVPKRTRPKSMRLSSIFTTGP